jgi:sigma-B regulation protein RsbU (phosphoserine phosphatase)
LLRLVRLPHIEPEVLGTVPDEDLNDLYDNAPCGYLSLLPDGRIYMVNTTFLRWTGYEREAIIGTYLRDLLHIGARIFYETHFAPLLRMQGFFNEVALDISKADGSRLPVLANAVERRDDDDDLLFTRISLFQATDRRRYEREILELQAQTEAARRELAKANEELEDRVRTLVEERLAAQESMLAQKEASELREHFIAVLGHDLRNPLASIKSGLRMLAKEPISEKAQRVLKLMDGSADRMAGLISDVMDFARARLGSGIAIHATDGSGLEAELRQVIDEVRTAHPDREIMATIGLQTSASCDPARIGQMVSNLLGNAVTHGDEDQPITVRAISDTATLEIAVSNGGKPIPKNIQDRLFHPFFRGEPADRKEGLGLGLFIASEIAKSHSGSLDVISNEDSTTFIFQMPVTVA